MAPQLGLVERAGALVERGRPDHAVLALLPGCACRWSGHDSPLLDACAISSYAARHDPRPGCRPTSAARRSSPPPCEVAVVEGPGVHDGARRGGRDGHVERADPPLLRLDGRRAGGGVRAGRAPGPRGVRRGDGGGRRPGRGARGSSSGPTRRPTRTGRSSSGSTPGPRRPAGRRSRRRRAGSTSSGRGCSSGRSGRASRPGRSRAPDPAGAAWRILSLLDGLALQVVAHGTTISREDVVRWTTGAAEVELGLAAGSLGVA